MARYTITLEDTLTPDGMGVSMSTALDRSGEPPHVAELPATSAMLVGLTMGRLFQAGCVDNRIQFVCVDIMQRAKLTPEEMAEASKRAHAALERQSS